MDVHTEKAVEHRGRENLGLLREHMSLHTINNLNPTAIDTLAQFW